MIHEFIEKIIVHEAEGYRSERTQTVDIYLSFIDKFEVPVIEQTPEEIAAAEKLKHQRERKRGNINREIAITNNQLRQLRARITKLQSWLKEEAENTTPPTLADVISNILTRREQQGNYQTIINLLQKC